MSFWLFSWESVFLILQVLRSIYFSGVDLSPERYYGLIRIWPVFLSILIISILSGSLPLIQHIQRERRSLTILKEVPALSARKFHTYGILMIAQFTLSVGLMIAAITIYQQKEKMFSSSMGKMSSDILVFKKQNWEIRNKYTAFRTESSRESAGKKFYSLNGRTCRRNSRCDEC